MSEQILNPVEAISAEIESSISTQTVGMLRLKKANATIVEAARRPNPRDLYHGLWYEGEVCCLFADSNLGKSIYAVQMANAIARQQNVLYMDCELSDKQFQLRYYDVENNIRHIFPDGLIRAEIDPEAISMDNYEDTIIKNIEDAALVTNSSVIIIDNLTYLCNASDKGEAAGIFMMKLMQLKKKHNFSILIIAHTPKRNLANPITQNDLAGSKKLYNFFDSVFAIGKSYKDNCLRYVKQVKVRAGEYRYDSDNVLIYEIVSDRGFLHFEHIGYAQEKEHLKEDEDNAANAQLAINVTELRKEGKSIREIASELGITKSKVERLLKKAEISTVISSERSESSNRRSRLSDSERNL